MTKVPPGLTMQQANLSAKRTIDVSSHATTLSSIESAASVIVFSGAIAANTVYQLDATARCQSIRNDTTGTYRLSVKRGESGVIYPVQQGETLELQ